jgi:hypothetical protein
MRDDLADCGAAPTPNWVPWTTSGGPDLSYATTVRDDRRRWLTDARLVERYRAVEAEGAPVYERMIRVLDLVWDCPDDAMVNVVGYRCAGCGSGRAAAMLAARCRDQA